MDEMTVPFLYEEDFAVNDESIDVLLEKLEATNRDRVEILGDPFVTRNAEALRTNAVYKLFLSIRDTVHITFFSKEEYKQANRKWIRKNWSSMHVEAFLTVSGLPQYSKAFKDKSVEGLALLDLGFKEILMQTFWMSAQGPSRRFSCLLSISNTSSHLSSLPGTIQMPPYWLHV
jgi:hypothetical protein